ncbi:MAG: sporulation integral membrane protein YtvI [Oscillospiraceae bacterium]|nr:sporulation integral membrane protein YtvI [Oscillospiraceae bacterium]
MFVIHFRKEPVKITFALISVIIAGVLVYFCLGGIGSVLITVTDLTMPFILGYAFAALTKPVSGFLVKKIKLPRQIAAVIVLVMSFGIIGAVVSAIVFKAADEARNFYMSVPHIYENMRHIILKFSDKWNIIYENLPLNIRNILTGMGESFSSSVSDRLNAQSSPIFEKTGIFAKKLPGFFVGFIVFILSSYFFISDDGKVRDTLKKLVNEKTANTFKRVGDEVKKYLGAYVKAQLSIMCVVFVILLSGFYFIRADYALFAALIIAVVDAIPFFGTGIALIPWAVVSFLNSDIQRGIGLTVIYLAVVLTRQLIEPKIISSNIGMHPLVTLMSMYAGYKLFSIGGMILGPVIMMLFISFYRAGIFDKPKQIIKDLITGIKKELTKH